MYAELNENMLLVNIDIMLPNILSYLSYLCHPLEIVSAFTFELNIDSLFVDIFATEST